MTTDYQFEFIFNNDNDPTYILHDTDQLDVTMLNMLGEFKVDIENIKKYNVIKL